MLTLIKLGGSLITNKKQRSSFRQDVMASIAAQIQQAWKQNLEMRLVIGHGSGSFGHFEANEYQTMQGVQTIEQWRGFARVATVAAELNYLVAKELQAVGLPVFRLQSSATALAKDGVIESMALENMQRALEHGLIPLVYGDVAFDTVRGGTIISTETIFTYLVQNLPVKRVLLLGEVDGVYDEQGQVIASLTAENYEIHKAALGGSSGVDVTGGMLTKVQDMLALASQPPYPVIQILNGQKADLLGKALLGEPVLGTIIRRSVGQ